MMTSLMLTLRRGVLAVAIAFGLSVFALPMTSAAWQVDCNRTTYNGSIIIDCTSNGDPAPTPTPPPTSTPEPTTTAEPTADAEPTVNPDDDDAEQVEDDQDGDSAPSAGDDPALSGDGEATDDDTASVDSDVEPVENATSGNERGEHVGGVDEDDDSLDADSPAVDSAPTSEDAGLETAAGVAVRDGFELNNASDSGSSDLLLLGAAAGLTGLGLAFGLGARRLNAGRGV